VGRAGLDALPQRRSRWGGRGQPAGAAAWHPERTDALPCRHDCRRPRRERGSDLAAAERADAQSLFFGPLRTRGPGDARQPAGRGGVAVIGRVWAVSFREVTCMAGMTVRGAGKGTAGRAPTGGVFGRRGTGMTAMRIVLALGIAALLIGLVPGR